LLRHLLSGRLLILDDIAFFLPRNPDNVGDLSRWRSDKVPRRDTPATVKEGISLWPTSLTCFLPSTPVRRFE
jgi:hypothetical protein